MNKEIPSEEPKKSEEEDTGPSLQELMSDAPVDESGKLLSR